MRLAIDVDETVADTLTRHIAWYNRDFNTSLRKQDLQGSKIYNAVPEARRTLVRDYPHAPAFFEGLDVLEDAQDVIRQLAHRHEVFFVTAAMEFPASFATKYAWLREHFPFISPLNYVFCGDKSIVCADYLIDDSPRHFEQFQGEGILFSAPHNLGEHRYHRVNNWREVESFFAPHT